MANSGLQQRVKRLLDCDDEQFESEITNLDSKTLKECMSALQRETTRQQARYTEMSRTPSSSVTTSQQKRLDHEVKACEQRLKSLMKRNNACYTQQTKVQREEDRVREEKFEALRAGADMHLSKALSSPNLTRVGVDTPEINRPFRIRKLQSKFAKSTDNVAIAAHASLPSSPFTSALKSSKHYASTENHIAPPFPIAQKNATPVFPRKVRRISSLSRPGQPLRATQSFSNINDQPSDNNSSGATRRGRIALKKSTKPQLHIRSESPDSLGDDVSSVVVNQTDGLKPPSSSDFPRPPQNSPNVLRKTVNKVDVQQDFNHINHNIMDKSKPKPTTTSVEDLRISNSNQDRDNPLKVNFLRKFPGIKDRRPTPKHLSKWSMSLQDVSTVANPFSSMQKKAMDQPKKPGVVRKISLKDKLRNRPKSQLDPAPSITIGDDKVQTQASPQVEDKSSGYSANDNQEGSAAIRQAGNLKSSSGNSNSSTERPGKSVSATLAVDTSDRTTPVRASDTERVTDRSELTEDKSTGQSRSGPPGVKVKRAQSMRCEPTKDIQLRRYLSKERLVEKAEDTEDKSKLQVLRDKLLTERESNTAEKPRRGVVRKVSLGRGDRAGRKQLVRRTTPDTETTELKVDNKTEMENISATANTAKGIEQTNTVAVEDKHKSKIKQDQVNPEDIHASDVALETEEPPSGIVNRSKQIFQDINANRKEKVLKPPRTSSLRQLFHPNDTVKDPNSQDKAGKTNELSVHEPEQTESSTTPKEKSVFSPKENPEKAKVNGLKEFNEKRFTSGGQVNLRSLKKVKSPERPKSMGVNATVVEQCRLGTTATHSTTDVRAELSTLAYHTGSERNGLDDEVVRPRPSMKQWDPTKLLNSLYTVRLSQEAEPNASEARGEQKEGVLEKLPMGKKKATLLKTWKRRHFRLHDGVLSYYDSASSGREGARMQIMGGSVEDLGQRMNGIDDGRGHYLMVRALNPADFQSWYSALLSNIVENSSLLYVHPKLSSPAHSSKKVLIVDMGSTSVRAGLLPEYACLPSLYFPSVLAVSKSGNHVHGSEALKPEVRSNHVIRSLSSSSNIDKFNIDIEYIPTLFAKIFRDLKIDPEEYLVLVIGPQTMSDSTRNGLLSLLFEKVRMRGVCIINQTMLALHSYKTNSGVLVDIGERTEVVPVNHGYVMESAVKRLPIGGRLVCEALRSNLTEYRLYTEIETYITRYVMENSGFISTDYASDLATCLQDSSGYSQSVDLNEFEIPDPHKRIITHDLGRFKSAEGLFDPEILGLEVPGIHKAVHQAIQLCPMDGRREMYRGIYLSGGVSKLPGFAARLQAEISKLTNSSVVVQVHAAPNRHHAAYIGACVVGASDHFEKWCISQHEWKRLGIKALSRWK